jgi:hypothetical protein
VKGRIESKPTNWSSAVGTGAVNGKVHPPFGEKKTWMSAAMALTAKKRAKRIDFMQPA